MKRLIVLLVLALLGSGVEASVTCSTVTQTCVTGGGETIEEYTVATLPASHAVSIVTDGNAAGDCTTGGGSTRVLCAWTGSAWAAIGDGNSGAAPTFADVTAGTNAAALVVGTGGTLAASGSGTIAATTAAALAANGGNCAANEWAAGVTAAGVAEGCTADDDVPDAGEVDDTALAAAAVDGGTGGEIADDSITAADIDETGAFAFATLTGKQSRTGTAVNDDDCTGEQGSWWWDSTDSAFEWCNDNSGTPAVLGGAAASGITLKCKGAPAVATTGTTEEVLATCSLSAGELSAAGHAIRISFFGHTAANTNNKVYSVRVGGIGGTVVYTSGNIAANDSNIATTFPISVSYLSSTTATAAGTLGRQAAAGTAWTDVGKSNRSASITWANALDVVITATTATASGDATLDTYQVELLK